MSSHLNVHKYRRQRGGRPRLPVETIKQIRSLRAQGKTIDHIMGELDPPVSRGAVAKYTREYDNLPERARTAFMPFEWHRLEEYSLPWEASAYLLEMWAFFTAGRVYIAVTPPQPVPTVREVRWWWRVHLAVPNLDFLNVWFLAERFALRELAHELLDAPLDVADLETHLAWRPWEGWPEDTSRLERYRSAVQNGQIPPLRDEPKLLDDLLTRMALDGHMDTTTLFNAMIVVDSTWERPELLPLQQVQLHSMTDEQRSKA